MVDIKELLNDFLKQLEKDYKIVKEQILVLYKEAKKGIYLSKNEFERTLDILFDYSLHLNVKEEFELLSSVYINIYPDSIESYKMILKEEFDFT